MKVQVVVDRVREFLANCLRSPKTTSVGLVAVANGVRLLLANPAAFVSNEAAITSFLVGLGMLFAADQNGKEGK